MGATGVGEEAGEQLLGQFLVVRAGGLDERDRPSERRPVGGEHSVDVGVEIDRRRATHQQYRTGIWRLTRSRFFVTRGTSSEWASSNAANPSHRPRRRRRVEGDSIARARARKPLAHDWQVASVFGSRSVRLPFVEEHEIQTATVNADVIEGDDLVDVVDECPRGRPARTRSPPGVGDDRRDATSDP